MPLAYCSKQPRLPQPHSRPSGTTRMWPISAADAERAAEQLAVEHDAAADAGADGDQQQVVDVLAGAEGELAPGRGVRVVLDDDRQVDPLLEVGLEVHVAPGEVGREHHRRPGLVDVAGRADADGGDLVARLSSVDQLLDGLLDRLGVGRRRLDAQLLDDRAVLVDDAAGDLGAADVDAAGQASWRRPRPGRRRRVVRVEVDVLHPGRLGGSAAPAAASSPAAAWSNVDAAVGELRPHLRAGLAHGVHGAADRAVGALGVAGRDVLVDVADPVAATWSPAQSASAPSSLAASSPTLPTGSSWGGVIRRAPSWPSVRCGRILERTRSTPSSSTRAPVDLQPGQARGQREQPAVGADGHHQLVAVAGQVDLGRG